MSGMDCMIGRVKPAIPRGEVAVGDVGDLGDLGGDCAASPVAAGTWCWSVDAVLAVAMFSLLVVRASVFLVEVPAPR